jgi:hypothetical protein
MLAVDASDMTCRLLYKRSTVHALQHVPISLLQLVVLLHKQTGAGLSDKLHNDGLGLAKWH